MSTMRFCLLMMICGTCLSITALANELMVFPSDGQSAEQQKADEFECYNWAKEQSGFDPMAPPTATQPPPTTTQQSGNVRKGIVRGAALGAVVGSSSRDTRKGAAAGVTVGVMKNQNQKKQDQMAREQWEQQQVAIYTENRNRYNRGYSACMEGKNYTVR